MHKIKKSKPKIEDKKKKKKTKIENIKQLIMKKICAGIKVK